MTQMPTLSTSMAGQTFGEPEWGRYSQDVTTILNQRESEMLISALFL